MKYKEILKIERGVKKASKFQYWKRGKHIIKGLTTEITNGNEYSKQFD